MAFDFGVPTWAPGMDTITDAIRWLTAHKMETIIIILFVGFFFLFLKCWSEAKQVETGE